MNGGFCQTQPILIAVTARYIYVLLAKLAYWHSICLNERGRQQLQGDWQWTMKRE